MLAHRFRMVACMVSAVVFILTFCLPSSGQEGGKVAVLYFTDDSGFDSKGGCLSFWPLSVIFGTGKQRETWDLESGFRDLLNEKLTEAGYETVDPGQVDEILHEVGKQNTADLVGKLGTDIMIVGDIRKFEQHRTRASSQGPTNIASGEGTKLRAMGGIGGFYYSSTIETNIVLYDNTGDQLEESEVNSKKTLRDFYMGVGLLTYHRGDSGKKEGDVEVQDPIVDYKKLDAIKFGSDEFRNRTLLGIATTDVMDQIEWKVEEYLEPPHLVDVQGEIIYVGTGKRLKKSEVYINLGAGDGMKPGLRLEVCVKGLKLTDPDTGEELGTVDEKKAGAIKISKVEADHLSIAEIVEGAGQIERGNIVKRETKNSAKD